MSTKTKRAQHCGNCACSVPAPELAPNAGLCRLNPPQIVAVHVPVPPSVTNPLGGMVEAMQSFNPSVTIDGTNWCEQWRHRSEGVPGLIAKV